MDPFDKAIEYVLGNEGDNYVNTKHERSKYGINEKWHPDVDVKSLTRDEAVEIYRERYWQKYKLDLLPKRVAIKAFDTVVNVGPVQGVLFAQRAINAQRRGHPHSITEDGIMGPETAGAASQINEDEALDFMAQEQAGFYKRLTDRQPEKKQYLKGWLNRAKRLPGA